MPHGPRQLPLFLYGSLKPGGEGFVEFLAGRLVSVCDGSIRGRILPAKEENYPRLVPGEGRVEGVLVEVQPCLWRRLIRDLDHYENYYPRNPDHSLFVRRKTRARLESGEEIEAWTYFWAGDPSGACS